MARNLAWELCAFVNASPTPFHAVDSALKMLTSAGYKLLNERDSFDKQVVSGGKYVITRNGSSLIAFAVGKKWSPGQGFSIVGAHTDSPCLRVKPVSRRTTDGYMQVGVETYGGGSFYTWFDRDLAIAGRAMVRTGDNKITHKLFNVRKPLLKIPTLAIHFGKDAQNKFEYNKETHLTPILALEEQLNGDDNTEKENGKHSPLIANRHHPALVECIAKSAGCDVKDLLDFECSLYDLQESVLGGLHEEFIYSARLDNLEMSFCAVKGLIEASKESLDEESTTRVISLFDHEEIGSVSAQGAASNFLPVILKRLSLLNICQNSAISSSAFEESLRKSLLVSADQSHACHPNYPEMYESKTKPAMGHGVVIKTNSNQKYATSSPGIVLLHEIALLLEIPLQCKHCKSNFFNLIVFVVRNDALCGSTIGPMLSAQLGMRTIDIGIAQLSMHSIRETSGSADVDHAVHLLAGFFQHFATLEKTIIVDETM